MKIGQISFFEMTTPADRPYGSQGLGSKYRGQRGPTPSRYADNFRTPSLVMSCDPVGLRGPMVARIVVGLAVTMVCFSVAGRRFLWLSD